MPLDDRFRGSGQVTRGKVLVLLTMGAEAARARVRNESMSAL